MNSLRHDFSIYRKDEELALAPEGQFGLGARRSGQQEPILGPGSPAGVSHFEPPTSGGCPELEKSD